MTGHLSDDELELYVVGKLSGPELDRLEDHLMLCERCRTRLERTEEYVTTMRAALRQARAADQPTLLQTISAWTRDWRVLSGAATVAVVLTLLVLPPRSTDAPLQYSDITLESTRGLEPVTHLEAGKAPVLRLDTGSDSAATGAHRVELAGADGNVLWSGAGVTENRKVVAKVDRSLAPGGYWVRLYAPDGRQIREFALRVDAR